MVSQSLMVALAFFAVFDVESTLCSYFLDFFCGKLYGASIVYEKVELKVQIGLEKLYL